MTATRRVVGHLALALSVSVIAAQAATSTVSSAALSASTATPSDAAQFTNAQSPESAAQDASATVTSSATPATAAATLAPSVPSDYLYTLSFDEDVYANTEAFCDDWDSSCVDYLSPFSDNHQVICDVAASGPDVTVYCGGNTVTQATKFFDFTTAIQRFVSAALIEGPSAYGEEVGNSTISSTVSTAMTSTTTIPTVTGSAFTNLTSATGVNSRESAIRSGSLASEPSALSHSSKVDASATSSPRERPLSETHSIEVSSIRSGETLPSAAATAALPSSSPDPAGFEGSSKSTESARSTHTSAIEDIASLAPGARLQSAVGTTSSHIPASTVSVTAPAFSTPLEQALAAAEEARTEAIAHLEANQALARRRAKESAARKKAELAALAASRTAALAAAQAAEAAEQRAEAAATKAAAAAAASQKARKLRKEADGASCKQRMDNEGSGVLKLKLPHKATSKTNLTLDQKVEAAFGSLALDYLGRWIEKEVEKDFRMLADQARRERGIKKRRLSTGH